MTERIVIQKSEMLTDYSRTKGKFLGRRLCFVFIKTDGIRKQLKAMLSPRDWRKMLRAGEAGHFLNSLLLSPTPLI